MSDQTIEITGLNPEWEGETKNRILEVLRQCGISYRLATFRWSADRLEVVNIADGTPAEGATFSVAFPPVEEFLANFEAILVNVSASLPGSFVTIPYNGRVEAAIGGGII